MKNDERKQIARALDRELSGLRVSDGLLRRICDAPNNRGKVIAFPSSAPAKRRVKVSAALIAACVAVTLLAATALAAVNHWGVFDFLADGRPPIAVSDGAKALVKTNLGTAEAGGVSFTLRELAFDGKGLLFTLYAEPAGETGWLASDRLDYDEDELHRTGDPAVVLGGYPEAQNGQGTLVEQRVDARQEGRGVVFFYQGVVSGDGTVPDALKGEVLFTEHEFTDEPYSVSIPFEAQARPGVSLTLTPDEPFDALDIVDISLTHTDMGDYVKIVYHSCYDDSEGEPFAIEPDATYYQTENGMFFHSRSDCSGMKNAVAVSGASLAGAKIEKPPCPVCLLATPPEAGFTGYDWRFCLLDDEGSPLDHFAYATNCADDRETYTAEFFVQRGEVKTGYTLRAEHSVRSNYDALKRAYTVETVANYDVPLSAQPTHQEN